MKCNVFMRKQIEIAKTAKVSQGALSNIMNGRRRPSWPASKRLAAATGTAPEIWLEGTPEEIRAAIDNNSVENGCNDRELSAA